MPTKKHSFNEWDVFSQYLDTCILQGVKTDDKVKEYFFVSSADKLNQRIKKKMAIKTIQRDNYKPFSIQVELTELLTMSIYFNRYPVHSFLRSLETSFLNLLSPELLKVLTPTYSTTDETN